MMDFGWMFTVGLLAAAALAGYVAYAKVRAGQQHGEAWIDALLAKVRGKPAAVDPLPAPAVPIVEVDVLTRRARDLAEVEEQRVAEEAYRNSLPASTPPLTQADVERAVEAALERAQTERRATWTPPKPPPLQPAPAMAPTQGDRTMHPASNAYLLDPAGNYPDVSPDGYGLYYQVGGDKKPVPGTVPTLSYAGITSFKDKAAIDAWIAASKRRDAALDTWAETWKAETFSGPISVAGMQDKPGDLAYLDARVEDYKVATNRDLFRDVFAGTNPEIMNLRNIGNAHMNQGLPYDQALPGVVDTLKERHKA